MQKIRKIVLVGHDNQGSSRLFQIITEAFPHCEFLLVETQGLYHGMSYIQSIFKLLREASLLFVLMRFFELVKYKITHHRLKDLAGFKNIDRIETSDINSQATINQIKEFCPDILVSLFTMQIYKAEVLGLPAFGAITSHPSIIPQYRGLEVFFWVLANGEDETGVSVFYLNEKIDYGSVLWQQRVPIYDSTTVASLYSEITEIGGLGLVEVIRDIDKGETSILPMVGSSSYYPMPDRASVRRFLKSPHKFF